MADKDVPPRKINVHTSIKEKHYAGGGKGKIAIRTQKIHILFTTHSLTLQTVPVQMQRGLQNYRRHSQATKAKCATV